MAGPDDQASSNNDDDCSITRPNNNSIINASSFSRLLDETSAPPRNNNSHGGLRRRGSLFGDLPSRQSSNDETTTTTTTSSFSLSSMLQTTEATGIWQRRHRQSQKRRRDSSTMHNEEEAEDEKTDSLSSASRSLFANESTNPMTMTTNTNAHTVCNTQDIYNTNHTEETSTLLPDTPNKKRANNNYTHSSTPKASGRGQSQSSTSSGGRTSLFGSVMQQVGNKDHTTMTPMKQNQQQQQIAMSTPLLTRGSVFSPPKRATEAFGTPGGFQLLDFVNNFGSPFSNNRDNNSNHSHLSTSSSSTNKEWNNASLRQGFMDWSLPETLRFDCHPATVVNPILQTTKPGSGLGLLKFLQPVIQNKTNDRANGSCNNEGLADWEAGLLYWQHPAVYPSPFVATSSKAKQTESKTAGLKADAEAATKESDRLLRQQQQNQITQNTKSKKKRRTTLDLAETKLVQETTNTLASTVVKPSLSSLQRQTAKYTRNRRLEWQQAFGSLYWKWISQLQQKNAENKGILLEKTYFYARGEDHTVLFRGDIVSGQIVPKILFTGSSASFRRKLLQSGVEAIRFAEAWNGHNRDAIFKEEMIRPRKAPSSSKGKRQPALDDPDSSRKENTPHPAQPQQPHSSPLKQDHTAKAASSTPSASTPKTDSNSPFVKAELAALRRAQVFGETVGADVTVAVKPKVLAGPKLLLGTCPPLFVSGWDDCAAFFEVYLNIGTCCSIPSTRDYAPRGEAATEDDEATSDKQPQKAAGEQSTAQPQVDWQWRHDVPLLVCRGIGPFTNATMKSLVVRGTPQYGSVGVGSTSPNNPEYASLEIQGGPILPCAMFDLFRALAQTMIADQNQRPTVDTGTSGEEALVGSHSLILRALPAVSERQTEELVQKHGIVGSSCSSYLNNYKQTPTGIKKDDQTMGFETEDGTAGSPDQIPYGKMIGTAVWDILHPDAMAYKLESVAHSTSPLSLLLKSET